MHTVRPATLSGHPSLEPVLVAKTHAFVATQFREPAHHFVWHYHPETELTWNRQGQGMRYVGQSVARFEAGDVVLVRGNVPHTWASAPEQRGEAIWTVIHFLPERWGPEFWQLPELRKLRALLAGNGHDVRFTGARVWKIGEAIEKFAATPARDARSVIKFLSIGEELVRTPHYRLSSLAARGEASDPDSRLRTVLDWLEQHIALPVSESAAAAAANMSAAAFSRWFKQRVGCTFERYLNELRVARVCARLVNGPESITEAAFGCGYNSLANFNRRFRELTGLSPTEFRSQTRQMQEGSLHRFLIRLGRPGAIRVVPDGRGRSAGMSAFRAEHEIFGLVQCPPFPKCVPLDPHPKNCQAPSQSTQKNGIVASEKQKQESPVGVRSRNGADGPGRLVLDSALPPLHPDRGFAGFAGGGPGEKCAPAGGTVPGTAVWTADRPRQSPEGVSRFL
jgi:AraC-like DNA-binding protein/quercetin dioxygenase-like cupin family protein